MSSLYKFLGSEITLPSTANTVGMATCVRITNPTNNVHVVTHKNAANTTLSTFSVIAQSEISVMKVSTDTLQVDTGTDLKAGSIAFTN